MIKCFLSHSSKDKDRYVKIVGEKIGLANCHIDEFTFEEGEITLNEIIRGLSNTDLFVIFISDNSLDSIWVQKEIILAKEKFDYEKIKKIFPIIINSAVKHHDSRLPSWMKNEYNIRYIPKPTIAAKRIRQKLLELSWILHPNLKDKKKIFVGRNKLINSFEERIDNFDIQKPYCIIASGIPSIGRRSLMFNCLMKANVIEDSYRPVYIHLNNQDSIEDFILKVKDLGFSDCDAITDLYHDSVESKVNIALNLIKDISSAKEIVFIIDDGCIVTYDRNISEWFIKIIDNLSLNERLVFCMACKFRPKPDLLRRKTSIFHMEVPELHDKERKGLLARYAESRGLSLDQEVLNFFSDLLTGYPEQVFFTVEQICDQGIAEAKRNSNLIAEYNSNRINRLLSMW